LNDFRTNINVSNGLETKERFVGLALKINATERATVIDVDGTLNSPVAVVSPLVRLERVKEQDAMNYSVRMMASCIMHTSTQAWTEIDSLRVDVVSYLHGLGAVGLSSGRKMVLQMCSLAFFLAETVTLFLGHHQSDKVQLASIGRADRRGHISSRRYPIRASSDVLQVESTLSHHAAEEECQVAVATAEPRRRG
jgi:hypothetical protein